MPRAGFEPAIPATKRPQTYVSHSAATGIGYICIYTFLNYICAYIGIGVAQSVSDYGLDDREIEARSEAKVKGFFPVASESRPAMRPTQPPAHWIAGVISRG
jgi:hypothetical protein